MNASESPASPVPQRWVRPLNFPPGHWKKQLPGKYLEMAERGDLNALQALLAEHPEFLSKRGSHNRTFLWAATRKGRLEMVQWLIAQGADLDAVGCHNGESYVQLAPYCAAIYYRRTAVAEFLRTQLPQLDIFQSAFLGDQRRVADMLQADATLLNAEAPYEDVYYVPLIAFPIAGGHTALVEDLLERGAVVPPYSAQLLFIAAGMARRDLIDLLVRYGAQVNPMDTGFYGHASDLDTLEYLLKLGASPNATGRNGFPPLVFVARADKGEHPEKIQLLLDYGAEINAIGPKGKTALHLAAGAGFVRVVRLLLERGANVTLRDHAGETALSLARAAGKTAVVDLLTQQSTRR
jgi:uncharacterized protein